ncbi:MAG: ABC transporter ATP-binding protein, partial [Planctomycetaceae bacterium]|nr:ABC transporter ATP-binding protein [Planctomycetaceae bacterium]
KQKVALARALLHEPAALFLDEPTSGLDPLGTRDMKDMIIKLREQGKTVVMSSHLLADVQDVCDRIAILYSGELKVIGNVSELLQEQNETQILTSRLSDDAVREVKEVLARHQANVMKVDHPKATLEDLFLRTVYESKARPGRRFVPGERPGEDSPNETPMDGKSKSVPAAARAK